MSTTDHAKRIDDLGRIITSFNDVTTKLQRSHDQLTGMVDSLRQQLREKDELLERRNRLAAVGEMAAGMAHEIRNPLGGIKLYASMLARELVDRPESAAWAGKITGGVCRLERLVSQVLDFAREIKAHRRACDLTAIVAEAIDLARPTLTARRVECRLVSPQLTVNVDPVLVGQAVLNLVLNAAEACDGGAVVVTVRPFPCVDENEDGGWKMEDGKTSTSSILHSRSWFSITVSDTGPGIPADVLDRVFNPFFTTKATGTGLGLAIVHRVVEAHDGTVTASNVDGGGAKFEIRI